MRDARLDHVQGGAEAWLGAQLPQLVQALTGEIDDPEEYRVEYGPRGDRWSALVLSVLKELGANDLMAVIFTNFSNGAANRRYFAKHEPAAIDLRKVRRLMW